MRNHTANAVDNHRYRETTLRRIHNVFNSVPAADEKAIRTWVEIVAGTLHEYFELIWPEGLDTSFKEDGLVDGFRIVGPEAAEKSPHGLQLSEWDRVPPLKAKDMHAFFDIRINPAEALTLAAERAAESPWPFAVTLPVRLVCTDAAGFQKRNKTTRAEWITNLAHVMFDISHRIDVECGIADYMESRPTDAGPFDFRNFCKAFYEIHEQRARIMLVEDVLRAAVRAIGVRQYDDNYSRLFFELAHVLTFNYREDTHTGAMTLSIPRGRDLSSAEIFSMAFNADGVHIARHDSGRMDWLEGSQRMVDCARNCINEALFGNDGAELSQWGIGVGNRTWTPDAGLPE